MTWDAIFGIIFLVLIFIVLVPVFWQLSSLLVDVWADMLNDVFRKK